MHIYSNNILVLVYIVTGMYIVQSIGIFNTCGLMVSSLAAATRKSACTTVKYIILTRVVKALRGARPHCRREGSRRTITKGTATPSKRLVRLPAVLIPENLMGSYHLSRSSKTRDLTTESASSRLNQSFPPSESRCPRLLRGSPPTQTSAPLPVHEVPTRRESSKQSLAGMSCSHQFLKRPGGPASIGPKLLFTC